MNPHRRERLADLMSRHRPAWPPTADTATECDPHTTLAALRGNGIAPLGSLLSREQCATLVEYFRNRIVRDPYRPELGQFLPDAPRNPAISHVAYHDARDVVSAPGLLALANQPRLLNIAARFLGCKPTIAYMAAWWSYPTGLGPQQAEQFHRDVDDWRFLKLFVYLTDVGPDNGPHVYITTSAAADRLTQIRRFSDEEVTATFGNESVRTITGMAGEAFLENTFGIHKGKPMMSGRRLIFQVVYSMFALPYGPRQPVDPVNGHQGVPAGLDPWINRVYVNAALLSKNQSLSYS